MVGLKPSIVPPTLGVRLLSAGTAACIADLITFPLDTAKVRLQIQGEATRCQGSKNIKYRGVWGTVATMIRTEGPRSLYSGLAAGLQRQMSFASIRIGLYDSVKQFYSRGNDHTSIGASTLAACTTGGLAVALAQPMDVVKVRFQAQGVQKRYNGTLQAYKSIVKEEGIQGLWKGTFPNIARNAIVNCSELVTYDIIKETILRNTVLTGELTAQARNVGNISLPPMDAARPAEFLQNSYNFPCHFLSAFGAGFCTTVVASPVDVVKTRYMNSVPGQYKSALNCAQIMLFKEGPSAFYKGFVPSYLRLGSWNMVMFVSFEQLKRAMMLVRQS